MNTLVVNSQHDHALVQLRGYKKQKQKMTVGKGPVDWRDVERQGASVGRGKRG